MKKISQSFITLFIMFTSFLVAFPVHAENELATQKIPDGLSKSLQNFYAEYGFYCGVGLAIGSLSAILAFIILFMQLGANGQNPIRRQFIIREIFIVGICLAFLGSIDFITGFYYIMYN